MSPAPNARHLATAIAVATLAVAAACGPPPGDDPPGAISDADSPATTELPAELTRRSQPPEPELLLPPLSGYSTDDSAESGELMASLDHGPVPYVDVRRRLVLDESGFTMAEVSVVTLAPESDGARRCLDHLYGNAARAPAEIAGVEMLRVDAEPHAAFAWVGPTFVVTFERGQEVDDDWLRDLARATVRSIVQREG